MQDVLLRSFLDEMEKISKTAPVKGAKGPRIPGDQIARITKPLPEPKESVGLIVKPRKPRRSARQK